MIGLREKEKAQAPRGPFRGVVRLHVRRLPPLALPTHSRARVPLAGGEPGTGPPRQKLGSPLLVACHWGVPLHPAGVSGAVTEPVAVVPCRAAGFLGAQPRGGPFRRMPLPTVRSPRWSRACVSSGPSGGAGQAEPHGCTARSGLRSRVAVLARLPWSPLERQPGRG